MTFLNWISFLVLWPPHWGHVALDTSFMARTGLLLGADDSLSASHRPVYPREFALLGDDNAPDSLRIPFTHVRMEARRIRFDPSRERVHAERITQITQPEMQTNR